MNDKICVVMSTYNGEKYVSKQIESILNQKNVDVILYIRDDGSTDNTPQYLKKYASNHSNVLLSIEKNVGFRKSFFKALKECPAADYYAFSDQDDVWFENKLYDSLQNMKENRSNLVLCNAYETDKDLNITNKLYNSINISAFPESLSNCQCHGFLMLFDKKIKDLATLPTYDEITISHDFWVMTVSNLVGKVSCDIDMIVALHRRLSYSVSKNTFKKRISLYIKRIKSLFKDEGILIHYSSVLKKYLYDYLDDNKKMFIDNCICYRTSKKAKQKLLKSKMKFKYKFKIFLNKY